MRKRDTRHTLRNLQQKLGFSTLGKHTSTVGNSHQESTTKLVFSTLGRHRSTVSNSPQRGTCVGRVVGTTHRPQRTLRSTLCTNQPSTTAQNSLWPFLFEGKMHRFKRQASEYLPQFVKGGVRQSPSRRRHTSGLFHSLGTKEQGNFKQNKHCFGFTPFTPH